MVTPTGGAKDITPPNVVEAVPENQSINFHGDKIEITFDEFVTLDNANQNVLFSPPLSEKPDIKLKNKTVVIKFKEPLKENTTYTINFGNAVKDFHEGNLFKDYLYSFSTGEVLDTMRVSGKVLDAESKKPVNEIMVGVYGRRITNAAKLDSLFERPLRMAPDFITKTDKEGRFSLCGLPDQEFLVFALNDMNTNLFYDMPNETVAFLDSLVPACDSLTLYAFTELDTTQMLLEKKLVEEGLLRFSFRQPADEVSITIHEPVNDSFQYVKVWSAAHDTLLIYFTPNVIDSLRISLHYDTIINDDTRHYLKYRDARQRPTASPKLKISNNLKNNLLMPEEDFTLTFSEPVVKIQWHDTSTMKIGNNIRHEAMDFEKADDYGMVYRLKLPSLDTLSCAINITDSVFYSVRGRTNDSLHYQFKRATEKDIGNIYLTVVPPDQTQLVIQLLNARGAVVDTAIITEEQRVEFHRLLPEKYKLKAIIDNDRNGKWSTGNYHRVFLPETVVDYKDELDLKPGWDIDLDDKWIIKR